MVSQLSCSASSGGIGGLRPGKRSTRAQSLQGLTTPGAKALEGDSGTTLTEGRPRRWTVIQTVRERFAMPTIFIERLLDHSFAGRIR